MNILFCDDEPDILELYLLELESLAPEHNYFMATHAHMALDICKREKIDIIFTDLEMPNMNGIQLLQKLKTQSFAPKKAYMITGFVKNFDPSHEIHHLVETVYPKPPNFEILLGALA